MKLYCRALMAVIFFFPGCSNDDATATEQTFGVTTILSTDSQLHFAGGVYYYRQQPFTGAVDTYYDSGGLHQHMQLKKGKAEGWQYSYYSSGKLMSKRWFHLGEKDSLQLGWYANGIQQYEYHCRMGKYHGDFTEWYASGQRSKHVFYADGKDQYGKGWRENGKIYMSYVYRDDRRYGLINSNLCYSLKNEKGVYSTRQQAVQ